MPQYRLGNIVLMKRDDAGDERLDGTFDRCPDPEQADEGLPGEGPDFPHDHSPHDPVLISESPVDRPPGHASPARDVVDQRPAKTMSHDQCARLVEQSAVLVRQRRHDTEHVAQGEGHRPDFSVAADKNYDLLLPVLAQAGFIARGQQVPARGDVAPVRRAPASRHVPLQAQVAPEGDV